MMKNIKCLAIFILVAFLISCEKKVVYPSTVNNKTSPIDTVSGKIYCIAGNGYSTGGGGYSGDGGPAIGAEMHFPEGVTLDPSGNIYICDCENCRVRKVNVNGIISTIAGNGFNEYSGDGGPATAAELYFPTGICMDNSGNIFISCNGNNRIRKINTNGIISTYAGNGYGAPNAGGYSGDGGPATAAEISLPNGLTVDNSGNLYIADAGNARVRIINTNGIISTVAGDGTTALYSGDGVPATSTGLNPFGVALDASGNMYIADYVNNRVRMVNTSGIIYTIAGNGFGGPANGGYSGDGGAATSAELFNPADVKIDGSGNIYISDADNSCIRLVSNGIISTIVGNGVSKYAGDGGPATAAELTYVLSIALDQSGNLYIADMYGNRIRKVYK